MPAGQLAFNAAALSAPSLYYTYSITLNASTTPTSVTALVKNITYQNTDTNAPTTGARTVRFVLTDGDGGTSANYDTTVTVSGVNDPPVITSNGEANLVN